MLDVGEVQLVLDREIAHARDADVVEQRLGRVGEQLARNEHPVAKAGLGDLDAGESAQFDDGLDHDRGGEDDVAAPDLDPGYLAALGHRHRRQRLDEVAEHLSGDHEPLDADVGLIGHALCSGREMRTAPPIRRSGRRRRRARGARQRLSYMRAEPLDVPLAGRARTGQELLGHAHRSERERLSDLAWRSATWITWMLPPPVSSTMPSVIVELLIAAT